SCCLIWTALPSRSLPTIQSLSYASAEQPMSHRSHRRQYWHCLFGFFPLCFVLGSVTTAQEKPKTPAVDPVAATTKAVGLAEQGRCLEALAVLKRDTRQLADKQLRYRAAMATARCAMSLNDTAAVLDAIQLLRRDFPDDPERLYLTARFFSQLANRTAQELTERFPASIQVAKMNAETLESRRMWDQAIEAYRKLLQQDPTLPDIRYRIASIMLDREFNAQSAAQATKELEDELKINPRSASAEFVLGEIARRSGDWENAVKRFARAGELDAGFLEAHLALGMSLNAAGKYTEAVAPLERYAKGAPDDPAGHYQLATTYARLGRKADADRAMERHQQALSKAALRRPPNAPPPK
ncbi:MAG TPA: tetratricopeptide repeat protein, partial [Verrucomicrobiae bacterium]|nr:tetratricopeptide repeat protein [Verrucomicrobiae bacterium]